MSPHNAAFRPALIMFEDPDSGCKQDVHNQDDIKNLLESKNMDLVETQPFSPDHRNLLQLCPSANYTRFIINQSTVSAAPSGIDLKTFIEKQELYIIGQLPAENCTLSIRTMLGDTIKASFRAEESLLDVKRWLKKENNVLCTSEEDEVVSRYTTIGHFKPSRLAFFSPATRTTFTESQELMRLKDLGLCPRSALLVRPDFDELAIKAARAAEQMLSFQALYSKSKILLQAIYQFFDYGVDEAQNDFQDMVEEIESEDVFGHSFFGAFAAPVPAGTSLPPATSVVDSKDLATEDSLADKMIDAQGTTAQVYGEEGINA